MNSIGPADRPGNPTFHHIGFVVAAIATCAERFARSVNASWNGNVIYDPIQGVRVTFLEPLTPQAVRVELVEPAGEKSRVSAFLNRGGGMHHLAYEVDAIEKTLRSLRDEGCMLVSAPQPAVAFANRRIAWMYTRDRLLVEYIER
jgi:methylmalonyl-CoA/ethylmalonyl-CoA epimerase